VIYEASECEGRIEIASLAIDLQFHVIWIFAAATRRRQVSVELRSTGQPRAAVST